MDKNKITFIVSADDKEALEKAIKDINVRSHADYKLSEFKVGKENNCKITVSKDKIIPEHLFMMGKKYEGFKSFNENPND